MKTILVPTEDHDAMPAVLEAALLMAKSFDSYLEGFAIRPMAGTYVTLEPVSSLALTGAFDGEAAKHAREMFEDFMKSHNLAQGAQEPATLSYGWSLADAVDDSFLGSYGRIFDLVVLGRPGRAPQNPRMAPLEAALFESGRPVLVVPPGKPQSIGRNVLVAWNGSTEQAYTNSYAMPLLRKAEQVTVLAVEGAMTPGPNAEQAAQHLRRNGVKATALTVKAESATAGEAILDHCSKMGCDLLVKGAYTHSRLRQMIFGGTTRHILANASVPVFSAH